MTRKWAGLVAALLLPVAMSAAPTFALIPANGIVSGAPGTTVGWGFTITNDTDYLLVSSFNFCEGAALPTCPTQTYGTFSDFTAQHLLDPVIVAPGGTVTQNFALAGFQGVGSFAINPGAPVGAQDLGTIFLTYDKFTCDVVNDLGCSPDQTVFGATLTATAQVDVTAVPEPAVIWLAGLGLAAMTFARRRRIG
jgi:hypothetical protein